jgi:hypothetical protein
MYSLMFGVGQLAGKPLTNKANSFTHASLDRSQGRCRYGAKPISPCVLFAIRLVGDLCPDDILYP